MVRKLIDEHRVVHDYGLYAMVKTSRAGDLKVCANLESKLAACN